MFDYANDENEDGDNEIPGPEKNVKGGKILRNTKKFLIFIFQIINSHSFFQG